LYDRKYIKEIKEFRKEAISYLMINNIPGASFAISKNGELIYSEGMGLASKDLEVPVTREIKFRIGVVSECLTTVMYQMLVQAGTLHPDSTVQFYLPEFPNKNHKITLSTLTNHTSGIRPPTEEEADWRGLNVSLQEGLRQFMNDTLIYSPGMFQTQSMYNYNLLGAVMEKATGKSFSQLLKVLVSDSLKLTNTETDNPFASIKKRSNFYDMNLVAQVTNSTTRDLRYKAPSEGLLSTAEDLVKLGNAMLYPKVLSENMIKEILQPVILSSNIPTSLSNGWIVMTDEDGRKFYGRAGGTNGGGASLVVYPDEKLVLAAVINLTDDKGEVPVMLFAKKGNVLKNSW
jgi:CubicO group peptidase (beta-lactamase class C family)